MKVLFVTVALVVLAIPAAAQTADTRWEPFLGCWELTSDNVRAAAPATAQLDNLPLIPRGRNANGPRVCVTPDAGGARFVTTVRGQSAIDQTLIADAKDRPISDAECRGTQRAEFSADSLRVFSRGELTCEGDPGPRRVSGISLLSTNGQWLDIQAVEIAGNETVRVRRYYRADGEAPIPRATLGASSLSLDDVKEAGTKTSPRALEAALVETNAGFYLSGKQLLALDDAGVPDSVIDVMVALSYPDRFVIERTGRGGGGGGTTYINDPFMLGWAFGYDDFGYSPYYYSPFTYSRYGYRGYGSAFGDGIAVVPVQNEPQPSGTARAVDGQGYTRIRPRETMAVDSGPVTSAGSSSSSGGSSSGGTSSTASSGGGYTGGGSSGDSGGRTAQPR